MTPAELAQVFVPVPIRWRHVNARDTFIAPDGQPWHVTHTWPAKGLIEVTALNGPVKFSADVDPDDVVDVLIKVAERDAVELTMEELGARVIARREATDEDRAALEQVWPAALEQG